MKKLYPLVFLVLHASVFAQESHFSGGKKANTESAAPVIPQINGQWIYGKETGVDVSRNFGIYMIGDPKRQIYSLLSAQEQIAIKNTIAMREKEDAEDAARRIRRIKPKHAFIDDLVFPKVVITSDSICVPLLEFSEDANWKNHLTCTERKTK